MQLSSKFWVTTIVLLLVASNVIWAISYSRLNDRYASVAAAVDSSAKDKSVLAFSKMFVHEVLGASGEVDFETRLALENSVRATSDQEIMTAWQRFLDSSSETAAQAGAQALLEVLIGKIEG